MKTQKKHSFRSVITSSILALALAGGLVPSAGLAFAAEAGAQDQTESQLSNTEDAQGTEAASSITNETVQLSMSSASSDAQENGAEVGGADTASAEAAQAESIPAAMNGSQEPEYTNGVNTNITSAEVRLVPVEETPQAVGSVEFDGIRYTINIDDPTTVAATGLATEKPHGEVYIQSQVAISGTLYPVTAIRNIEGGGSLL